MVAIKILAQGNMDSFLITYEHRKHILVDGGRVSSFNKYRSHLDLLINKKHRIAKLICTHVCADHVNGLVKMLGVEKYREPVDSVMFNSYRVLNEREKIAPPIDITELASYKKGNELQHLTKDINRNTDPISTSHPKIEVSGVTISILSPTYESLESLHEEWKEYPYSELSGEVQAAKENEYSKPLEELFEPYKYIPDKTPANKTSIAFLFQYKNTKILMLADSEANVITESLESRGYSETNKLEVDCVKLPHHGSEHNMSIKLLNMIKCKRWIVSGNKERYGHPSKKVLAHVIKSQFDHVGRVEFYFTSDIHYKVFEVDYKNDTMSHMFKCHSTSERDLCQVRGTNLCDDTSGTKYCAPEVKKRCLYSNYITLEGGLTHGK
jgi:beta-lactamase superfamily II metal-dependent hydrolase